MKKVLDFGLVASLILTSSVLSAEESQVVGSIKKEVPFTATVRDRELLRDFINNNLDSLSDDSLTALAKISATKADSSEILLEEISPQSRSRILAPLEVTIPKVSPEDLKKAFEAGKGIGSHAHLRMLAFENEMKVEMGK